MFQATEEQIHSVMNAISQEDFTPADIIRQYRTIEAAVIIKSILETSGLSSVDTDAKEIETSLNATQLDNILVLTDAVLTKHVLENKNRTSLTRKSEKKSSLFSNGLLNSLYKLQPA